ncbi:MAG: recombinase family protein [Candidatus Methylomirabilales bacterium]
MRNGNGRTRLVPTDPGFPVALYARVSTTHQDPDVQLRELRALVAARGWAISREYVDAGISGASTSRPELSRLLTDAHKGAFAGILVWRLDRLGRSLRHLVTVVEDLLARGIDVISATEPHMDSTTPTGRLLRNIFASVAEYEREMIRERVMAGLRKAKASGKRIGRPKAVLNRLRIEQLRGEGLSWREIARKMDLPKSTAYRYRRLAQNPSAAANC